MTLLFKWAARGVTFLTSADGEIFSPTDLTVPHPENHATQQTINSGSASFEYRKRNMNFPHLYVDDLLRPAELSRADAAGASK